MHINESSRRKMGGVVNVNLGGMVDVNLGRFGRGYRGMVDVNLGRFGRFGADWSNPSSIYDGSSNADPNTPEQGATYVGPGSSSGWTSETASPYSDPTVQTAREDTGSGKGAMDWISSLLNTAGQVAPGIITAVKGPGMTVGGTTRPGTLYQTPKDSMGIIVPVAIGAIVLVGAALALKGRKPAPTLAGYKRRKLRRSRR